jgi:4-hydroxymandelate oxidase
MTSHPTPLAVWHERASSAMPSAVAAYFAATTRDDETGDPGAAAGWRSLRLRPRALSGARDLESTTTVLGTTVSTPVLVAPMAQQNAAHVDAERATARGAASAGTLLGVSAHTAVPFDEIAAQGCPWGFQTYLLNDREITARLVLRAAEAGARALILTVDTTLGGAHSPGIDPSHWPEGTPRERLANLTRDERAAVAGQPVTPAGVDDIVWLRKVTGLPVVVKGILRPDDACRAVDAGAAAILVSTHGDRRVARSVRPSDVLGEVVDAVSPEVEVYADSGIRSGIDVLAALCLGARAVFVGRPVLWGLAAGGASGVDAVVRLLSDEFTRALDGIGARDIQDLDPSLIVRTP